MKTKVFNFIIKANQILFFIGGLLLISISSIGVFSSSSSPTVQIIESKEDNLKDGIKNKIIYDKTFVRHLRDIYIFKIHSNNIIKEQSSLRFSKGHSYNNNSSTPIINFIFVKKEGKGYKLFKEDTFIYSHKFIQIKKEKDYYSNHIEYSLDKNMYMIIKEDSNKDKSLTEEDQKDFYVSDYDGKNLKLILNDILEYKLISDNHILITKMQDTKKIFYILNIKSMEVVLLDTKITR